MLQREELCSQVLKHLTLKQTPQKTKEHAFSEQNTLTCAQAHIMGYQVPMNLYWVPGA